MNIMSKLLIYWFHYKNTFLTENLLTNFKIIFYVQILRQIIYKKISERLNQLVNTLIQMFWIMYNRYSHLKITTWIKYSSLEHIYVEMKNYKRIHRRTNTVFTLMQCSRLKQSTMKVTWSQDYRGLIGTIWRVPLCITALQFYAAHLD